TVLKRVLIQLLRIANTVGKSFSAKDYTFLTSGTRGCRFASPAIIIYSGLMVPGMMGVKRPQLRYVGRSQWLRTVERLRSGVMEPRLDLFFILTNAWKLQYDSLGQ